MHDAAHSTGTSCAVDNTDWLKAAAIVLVTVDHIGYFFIADGDWWSVVGRLAAPPFFFLMGYAQTRAVPFRWLWLGVILTLLDSMNHGWSWVAPNILFSFALIRFGRPVAETFIQRHGWVAFAILTLALFALLPITPMIVDYGAEGWLWASFGLCQRMYVDGRSATTTSLGLMRLLACLVAAVAYAWREQLEFSFSQIQFAAFTLGVGVLSLALSLFRRGPSRIQPPRAAGSALRFVGRHTLEIYAIELACFELTTKFAPALAP